MTPASPRDTQSLLTSHRPASSGAATEVAARLMSETAHDLRSPLNTVRESVRLVHDGDLGELNSDQKGFLASAMDQCDCINQMIDEMVQLERLRTGTPRANRRWVPVGEIRQAVDETLRPWALPRQIDVLWDAWDDPSATVFADPSMLRRLIVNLVTNAIRASQDNSRILIRLMRDRADEMIEWSVIDHGVGISARDMARISDRLFSSGGGEGLGLSICRQLAAVHFSPLQIRSRLGLGTEVGFKTPTSGPRSVANAWAQWRVGLRGPLHKPQHRTLNEAAAGDGSSGSTVRLDPPSVAIELSHEATKPRCQDRLAAGVVSVGATVSRDAADAFDRLLQSQLQMFDFAYRVDTRHWVWIFDTDAHGVQDRIDSINDAASAQIGSTRTIWTEPQMIPIDQRRTQVRLSDLMVRESLSASTSSRVIDQNEVRLGTAPLVHSDVAENRLDVELRRLASQFQAQTSKLRQQAKNIRLK